MQKKNKPKKQRVLLSLTVLTSIFAQLTAPVAVLAAEEINNPDSAEETSVVAPEQDVETVEEDPTEEAADNDAAETEEDVNAEDLEAPVEDTAEEDVLPEVPVEVEDETDTEDAGEEVVDEAEPADEVDADDEEEKESDAEVATAAATDFAPFQAVPENFELAIAHMNDTHANVGNYPRLVTGINQFRAANDNSLVLHAGDVFSGTLYFNQFQGEADLAIMNLMGIDAMTFGNHEFDLGSSDEGHAALGEFVANATFPFLGTNIDFSADPDLAPLETNASLVENPENGAIYESIVFNLDGEQVGVFGITTEDTANIASPLDIVFSDYIATAEAAVAELEAAGINKIVAVTHLGYSSAPLYGNDRVLAQSVDGIDIIVGGHSHTALEEPAVISEEGTAPTVIVQTGADAENLGTLNVTFDEAGRIVDSSGALLPVSGFEPDAEAADILAGYSAAVEELSVSPIGATAVKPLENPRHPDTEGLTLEEIRLLDSVRANETPLGNLITDAMLYKAREKFPEIAFSVQNGGGIRAPIDEGEITTGEVIAVLPFGNNPVIAEMYGHEIKELFEISVRNAPEENGGFLHVSGLELYYDSLREPGDRVVGMFIVRDGGELEAIDMDETYLVTTNGFTGIGGDGLTPFEVANSEGRVRDIGEIDWQQFRDYMVQEEYLNGDVDPVVEGRITDLLGEEIPKTPEEALQDLLDRLDALEAEALRLAAQNQAQAEELDRLRVEADQLRNNLNEANEDIAALEAKVAELEARIAELEEETPTDLVTELAERLAALEAALLRLSGQNQAQAEEIAALREEVAGLHAALNAADADLTALETRVAELEARVAELEEEEVPGEETPREETPGATDPGSKKPGADTDDGQDTDVKGKETKKDKDKVLPHAGTAMSVVLPLASGVTLLLSGLGVEAYRKKNNKQ